MAQRPRKGHIWHFFMICGWLLPQNHSPARRKLKNFRRLKFFEHDLRTLFWAIFGAKVTPPGYPVGVGVPEKGHLGSGEMGHPNLDEKNGCWKILPASGLVWASQSLLKMADPVSAKLCAKKTEYWNNDLCSLATFALNLPNMNMNSRKSEIFNISLISMTIFIFKIINLNVSSLCLCIQWLWHWLN